MLKSLLRSGCFVLLFCLCSPVIFAQKAVVKINPLGLFFGKMGGSVEYVLSERTSVVLSGAYINIKNADELSIAATHEKGFQIAPEIRLYPSGNYDPAPRNFFVGANVIYERLQVDVTSAIDTLNANGQAINLGFGATIGYQFIIGERFAVELFINPYFNRSTLEGNFNANSTISLYEPKSGFNFDRVGVSVGVAF